MWWYPTYGHPDGTSARPWFRVADAYGYRTGHHPGGVSSAPCFRVVGEYAFPAAEMTVASFRIIGSFAYPEHGEHPNIPWFQIKRSGSTARRKQV